MLNKKYKLVNTKEGQVTEYEQKNRIYRLWQNGKCNN